MNTNRTCVVCGTAYHYCNSCPEFNHLPRWMHLFHDQNCHDIYVVLNEYGAGKITKEEAQARFGELDLSGLDHFMSNYKTNIEKIMSDVTKKVESGEQKEEEPEHDVMPEQSAEDVAEAKPRNNNKRRNKHKQARPYSRTTDSDHDSNNTNGDTI